MPADPVKAWKDCAYCGGTGWMAWIYSDGAYFPCDEKHRGKEPCTQCAAHNKAVEEAYKRGAEQFAGRACRAVADLTYVESEKEGKRG